MNPNIRKGDTVILNEDHTVGGAWSKQVIPAGTKCRVFKSRRSGEIGLNVIENNTNKSSYSYSSFYSHKNKVTKIDQPITNTVKPGDIFVSTGGFEQTNVAFYKIIDVTKSTAIVCEVGSTRKYTGPMCGEAMPDVNATTYRSKVKRVKIDYTNNNSPCFKAIWGRAFRWNGQPEFFSEWH